jgi:hypothetical protein
MATMGSYVKAYPIRQLRAFPGWTERADQARPADARDDEDDGARPPRTLTDDDFLYLQDTLVVTDGIYQDEHVIFDERTPDWERFCHETLAFVVPVWEEADEAAPPAAAAS